MGSHLAVRSLRGIVVVFGVVALTFLLLHLAPGDPVSRLLGPRATPEQVEVQRHALGLDKPVPIQFGRWIGRALQGDLGTSIATGRPVGEMLMAAWPYTAGLVTLSLGLSYLLGVVIGATQALTRKPAIDSALTVTTLTLFAMPAYWLGLLLILVFTYGLRWLPAFGAHGLDADFLTPSGRAYDTIRHLALPLITLTLIGIGGIARYVRGGVVDLGNAPFLVAAAARGCTRRRVIVRHAIRNALIPVVTLLGLSLPALFSGTVFIEVIFAWPGVGLLMVQAVSARDYPVVMAATTISAILVIVGTLLADLMTAWVDPRVRIPSARA